MVNSCFVSAEMDTQGVCVYVAEKWQTKVKQNHSHTTEDTLCSLAKTTTQDLQVSDLIFLGFGFLINKKTLRLVSYLSI